MNNSDISEYESSYKSIFLDLIDFQKKAPSRISTEVRVVAYSVPCVKIYALLSHQIKNYIKFSLANTIDSIGALL